MFNQFRQKIQLLLKLKIITKQPMNHRLRLKKVKNKISGKKCLQAFANQKKCIFRARSRFLRRTV